MTDPLTQLESRLSALATPQQNGPGADRWKDGSATDSDLLTAIAIVLPVLGTLGSIGSAVHALLDQLGGVLRDAATVLDQIADAVAQAGDLNSAEQQAQALVESAITGSATPFAAYAADLANSVTAPLVTKVQALISTSQTVETAADTLYQLAQELTALSKAC